MATYNRIKKTYYTIAGGKLKRYEGEGQVSEFTGIDGIFKGIIERKHDINGETKTFTDFNFVDGDDNFCISCEKFGSNSNSIVRSLVNVVDFSKKILIEVWQVEKGGKTFNNVSVNQDGNRVSWVDIPDKESFQLPSGELVQSSKKRDDFVDELIKAINAKVGGNVSPAQPVVVEPSADDDVPDAPGYGPVPPEYCPPVEDIPPYMPNAGV